MRDAVIQVRELTKRFDQVVAVDSISFEVAGGTITALLGGNGAGKTTTLAMVLGLLLPTSGTVTVLGEDMRRHRHRVLPRINFSSPYIDLPRRLSLAENLTVYAHLYGLADVRRRIGRITGELGLEDLMDRSFGTLSAGQKTRASLAKALLNGPGVLLLDEPTASLDPDTADWVRGYLESYRDRTGATMFIASHNMAEVERLCSDVIVLRAGRLIDHGSPQALLARYDRATLEDVFLDIARGHGGEKAAAQ